MSYYKTLAALFFLISWCLFSCNPHFYKPKPLEPVLLSEANQFNLNTIADFSVTAVSIAYSPAQNFGLTLGTASNHYRSSGNISGRDTSYINERVLQHTLSAGFYKHLAQNLLMEIYGGAGMYNYTNTAEAYLKKMNCTNVFLQPSIAVSQKNLEAALTIRVNYLNRNTTIIKKDSILSLENQKKYEFLSYSNYFFIEPGITLRAGTHNIKLQFQIFESIPLSNNYRSVYGYGYQFLVFNSYHNSNKLKFSFGIAVIINNLLKEKKSTEKK